MPSEKQSVAERRVPAESQQENTIRGRATSDNDDSILYSYVYVCVRESFFTQEKRDRGYSAILMALARKERRSYS